MKQPQEKEQKSLIEKYSMFKNKIKNLLYLIFKFNKRKKKRELVLVVNL
jgi:hypothetical protein